MIAEPHTGSSTSRRPTPYVLSYFIAKGISIEASQILDELIISGELQESSKKSVLRVVSLAPRNAALRFLIQVVIGYTIG
jgi:hypothetical protein